MLVSVILFELITLPLHCALADSGYQIILGTQFVSDWEPYT